MPEHEGDLPDFETREDRFPRQAYDFVREAMRFTLIRIGERRHVSAAELLEGARDFALQQYGPLARTVLASCGIRSTSDVGELVFDLIDRKEFGRNDDDSREDFDDVYDFDDAFPEDPPDEVRMAPVRDEVWDDDTAESGDGCTASGLDRHD